MSEEVLASRLKALGDPTRLAILKLLPDSDDCEGVYNVSELAEAIGASQPTVSHHLKSLKHAGLVKCRRMCRDVYYWVDRPAVEQILGEFNALLDRPQK